MLTFGTVKTGHGKKKRKRKKEGRRKEMHTENEIISNRDKQQEQSNIIKN